MGARALKVERVSEALEFARGLESAAPQGAGGQESAAHQRRMQAHWSKFEGSREQRPQVYTEVPKEVLYRVKPPNHHF